MAGTKRVYEFGSFRLDVEERRLSRESGLVPLTPKLFDTLLLLVENSGHLLSKDELMKRLWPDSFVEEVNLSQNVSRLRKSLQETPGQQFIATVAGQGYRFVADVREVLDDRKFTNELIVESHTRESVVIEEDDDQADQSALSPIQLRSSRRSRSAFWLVPAAALILLAGTAWFYFWRVESKVAPPAIVPVTDEAEDPALSPDGTRVAFKRSGSSLAGIYLQQIGGAHPLQLTKGATDQSPAWSPDGTFIAFSRYLNAEHEIFIVSSAGGTERKLYSGAPAHPPLSWSSNGKFIAFTAKDPGQNTYSLNLLSVESLETRKLTQPSAEYQDFAPAFSPDGKKLAFIRANGAHTRGEIFIMPADGGEAHRLTFDNANIPSPPAWTRDNKSVVFSSTRSSIPTLWRISAAGGSSAQIPQIGVVAIHPSVSPHRDRLAFQLIIGRSSIWSIDFSNGKKSSRTQVTASGGFNWAPEFSPDGQRIAFLSDRLGTMEVWSCKKDGTDLIQLTKFAGEKSGSPPRWSPDGQRIAFDSAAGEHDAIFVMTAEGLFPRRLTDNTSDDLLPSWSHDGKWIYFTSNRTGQWQIWKMTSQGSEPLQLTKDGGFGASQSANGDFVYYAKTPSDPDIWRVPSSGGQEGVVAPRIHLNQWNDWALVDGGIFFRTDGLSSPRALLRFFDFSTTRVRDVTTMDKPGEWISASVDGKSVLYNQADYEENGIMLLENFR